MDRSPQSVPGSFASPFRMFFQGVRQAELGSHLFVGVSFFAWSTLLSVWMYQRDAQHLGQEFGVE